MATLTAEYVRDHMAGIHTEDSWARAIGEAVMHAAAEELGSGSSEAVTVDATFTVSALDLSASAHQPTLPLCVRVCVNIDEKPPICHHFRIPV